MRLSNSSSYMSREVFSALRFVTYCWIRMFSDFWCEQWRLISSSTFFSSVHALQRLLLAPQILHLLLMIAKLVPQRAHHLIQRGELALHVSLALGGLEHVGALGVAEGQAGVHVLNRRLGCGEAHGILGLLEGVGVSDGRLGDWVEVCSG
ncbi:hypothetical protein FGO68_gene15969 [Halteria grandinella]|uniref:Uncharacterized protein n=1 Tax=Halteria grandinella TaxID=5974 RepID=A0A8J8NF33_HALGN|nr:hypothetical protein FGO68_gene15969 [Halteria grandinella]